MPKRLFSCSVVLSICLLTGCAPILRTASRLTEVAPVKKAGVEPPSQAFEISNVDLAASKAELARFTDDVTKLMKARDFDGLEKMAAQFRQKKDRFIGGGWKIHSLYSTLSAPADLPITDESWRAKLEYLKAWKTAKPQSITAQCALVGAYIGYAWFARGEGYASEVPKDALPLIDERLELASAEAKAIADPAADPYGYFENILVLSKSLNWDRESFEKAFAAAVGYDATYPYFYAEKAVFLLPRWGGQPGDWEKFAAQARDNIGGDAGADMYYLIAAEISQYYGGKFFDENNVSWADVRKGFQVHVQQYGTTVFRLNQFGAIAFNARDPQAICKSFSFLTSDDFDSVVWKNKEGFEEKRRLAQMMCSMPRSDNMRK